MKQPKCTCMGKIFPMAFRKDEVVARHPEMHEIEYYCSKCNRHLGDEANNVDDDDPWWCDCPITGKQLSGREYMAQFEKFHG